MPLARPAFLLVVTASFVACNFVTKEYYLLPDGGGGADATTSSSDGGTGGTTSASGGSSSTGGDATSAGTGGAATGGGGGGAGGAQPVCASPVAFELNDPVAWNWEEEGAGAPFSQDQGRVTISPSGSITTLQTFDFTQGGCATFEAVSFDLPAGLDGIAFRLTSDDFFLSHSLEVAGTDQVTPKVTGWDGAPTSLGAGDDLKRFYRVCVNDEGRAYFYVSSDGVVYDHLSASTNVSADLSFDMVKINAIMVAASPTPSAVLERVEVCTPWAPP